MYGFEDSEKLTPGNQGGKFGLNTGAFLTKFEFNPLAGADGTEGEALDVTVKVGEKEYRHRFFPVGKIYGKSGGELTDNTTDEYKAEYKKEAALLNATLTDFVKLVVDKETIETAFRTPVSSFKNYAEVLEGLVKSAPNWDKTPIDVFLQYQWKPKGDNTVTFLEMPKNIKHGLFVVKSTGDKWTEQLSETSLGYVNEAGNKHPFKRGSWYLGSDFANRVSLEEDTASSDNPAAGTAAGW